MNPAGHVFISYSRKDYYFAESLAFHLERRGVRCWFDSKNLHPGGFWDRDIDAAIEAAACLVVVASPRTFRSPYARLEWERATKLGKRIVVALFRSTPLPPDLAACEIVDFRGAFTSALERLSATLQKQPAPPWRPVNTSFSLRRPPWIYILSLTLLVPLVIYLLLGNWAEPGANLAGQLFLAAIALALLGWFFFASFLRRRMGMTHLLVSLAFIAVCMIYPLLRFALQGQAALDLPGSALDRALLTHSVSMQIAAAFSLAGLFIFLVVRPDDLLRWTPTGAAWKWYRRASLHRVCGAYQQPPRKPIAAYCFLHDRADKPAAERFRAEMRAAGIAETPSASAEDFIVLLTSRTRNSWLADRERELPSNALLLVGTPIGLPVQFEHLWRREWLDFRYWDINKLDERQDVPKVPETVTRFRYPPDIRLAHHGICSLAAITWASIYAIDPALTRQPQETGIAAVCLFTFVLAHRFLNRTISERTFSTWWKISVAASALVVLWALAAKIGRHESAWGFYFALVVTAVSALGMARLKSRLAFWFPAAEIAKPSKEDRLKPGKNWQTLLWMALWLMLWLLLTRADALKV